MLAAIRRVARRRGVAFQDVEDVVQETVVLAMEAALPSDGEQARRYVLTVASHVALRQVHGRAASPPGLADDDVEGEDGADGRVVAQAVPFEDRDAIRLVVEHGESRSPRWFPIFLRAKLLGESTEEIAQVHGEAPGTVRRIWSEMYRDLGDYGRSLGIAVGVLVLVATGLAAWRASRRTFDFEAMAPYRVRRVEPPVPGAWDLRARAVGECMRSEWAACSDDAAAAAAMDPAVDTPEFRSMRAIADHQRLVRYRGPAPKWGPEKQ
jgi:DNA-directed RNA polymerase specialized sigma24 family protein